MKTEENHNNKIETTNLKLFSNLNSNSNPSNDLIQFPLKSSFKSISSPSSIQHHQFDFKIDIKNNPNLILKYNTQFNSISPSHPKTLKKIKFKSNLITTPTPNSTSTESSNNNDQPIISFLKDQSSNHSPTPNYNISNRIIRTPRSFLIKRRGSLTPLSYSLPPSNQIETSTSDLQIDPSDEILNKRKVRFDHDVFCLEFDQLPEELPLSRRKRIKVNPSPPDEIEIIDPSNSSSSIDQLDDSQQPTLRKRSQRKNSIINSSINRPRRHSPRLTPIKPIHQDNQNQDNHTKGNNNEQEQKLEIKSEKDSEPSYTVATSNSLLTLADISIPDKAESNQSQSNNAVDYRDRVQLATNETEIKHFNLCKNNLDKNFKQNQLPQPSSKPRKQFSSSLIGRQRSSSLNFDLTLCRVVPVDDLELKLNNLSLSSKQLDDHDAQKTRVDTGSVDLGKRLARSTSLPNCSSEIIQTGLNKNSHDVIDNRAIGKSFMPNLPGLMSFNFAPALEGVKQIFMDHPYVHKINDLSCSIQSFFNNSNSNKSSPILLDDSTDSSVSSIEHNDLAYLQLDDLAQIQNDSTFVTDTHQQRYKEACGISPVEERDPCFSGQLLEKEKDEKTMRIEDERRDERFGVKRKGLQGEERTMTAENDQTKEKRSQESTTTEINPSIKSTTCPSHTTKTIKYTSVQSRLKKQQLDAKQESHAERKGNMNSSLRPMTRSFFLLQQKNLVFNQPIPSSPSHVSTHIHQSPYTSTPRRK